MKTAFKRVLSFLLAATLVFGTVGAEISGVDFADIFSFQAEAATYSGTFGDNLTWSLNTSTGVLDITGTGAMWKTYTFSSVPWSSYLSSIKIVNIADGVTTIGRSAFSGCDSLTSVTIPDTVTIIGESAFWVCRSLESVTIPNGVITIEQQAFENCDSLKSITIPASVTTIGMRAVAYNDSLESITVDENNEYFSSDKCGVLFNKNKTELIQYPIGNARTNYEIPYGVNKIGEYSFDGCAGLTTVTIPDSVTIIDDSAFSDCNNLTGVTIPDSVITINDYAFIYCDALTSVTIGEQVSQIGTWVFMGCQKLPYITVDKDNASFSNDESGTLFNKDKTELIQYPAGNSRTIYTIPDSVTTIAKYAFYNCDNIISVVIPDSVTTINSRVFEGCDSLKNVIIPDSVTSIGNSAFYSCDSLEYVHIPASVTSIGSGILNYTSAYICSDTEDCYAKTYADNNSIEFKLCDGHGVEKLLTKIEVKTMPTKTEYFVGDTLDTTGLTLTATFSDGSTETIDSGFTCSPTKLNTAGKQTITVTYGGKTCTFDVTVEPADEIVSGQCGDNLTWTLNITKGILDITGTGAMTDYTSSSDVPWYSYRRSIKTVNIASGVTTIGDDAFYFCDSLTSVTIPDSVTTIGDDAFRYCDSLTSITVDENNKYYSSDSYGVLFNKDKTTLIQYPIGNARTSYTIPDSVTTIGDNAFRSCTSLTSITIPDSVTTIGYEAFRCCYKLTSVTIPDSVTTIGNSAFYICNSLEYVHIPASVISIGLIILSGTTAYICSDTEDCYAKTYADENGIEFKLCDGHGVETAEKITDYKQGDIVEFGWYPQSEVTNTALISALNSAGGEWISYNYYSGTGSNNDGKMTAGDYMRYKDVVYGSEKYRGVVFDSYRPVNTGNLCSAGNSVQSQYGYTIGTVYWFKYEPIKWRVLDPAVGLVMAETVIDAQPYNNYVLSSGTDEYGKDAYWGSSAKTHYANDYAESSIREWLNDDFYNTAFSSEQQSIIEYTTLDNSAYSSSYSAYDSATTTDKLYLLSWSDAKNTSYGFSSGIDSFSKRYAYPTAYAKAQGVSGNSSYETSYWWLRSPGSDSKGASSVYSDGDLRNNYYVSNTLGIRPAFKFNLNSEILQSEKPENITLTKIEIKTLPTKTEYFVGDTLDTTGLTLTATYSDGSTETVDSGFTCSPTTLSFAGNQSVTVTYAGKTCTFQVTVKAVELTKIEVKTPPTKTEYFVGDTLDTTGLTLTATYNDGSTETVDSGFTCSPTTLSIAGKPGITVSYGGKTCVFLVTVKEKYTCSEIKDQVYTGNRLYPTFRVYDADGARLNAEDYDMVYRDNINVGTAYIDVKGIGEYSDLDIITSFKIVPADASGFVILYSENHDYTGEEITPAVTVMFDDRILVEGRDYTLSYANNIEVGTGEITVTGKGNFEGSKTVYFNINAVYTEIVSIDSVDLGEVVQNTTFSALGLPETVTGRTVFNEAVTLNVSWNKADYSPATVGTQIIGGVVTVPEGYILADGAKAVATVTVVPDKTETAVNIISVESELEDIEVLYGTEFSALPLPSTVKAYTDVGEASLPVVWSSTGYDPYYYTVADGVCSQTVTGRIKTPYGYILPEGFDTSISVRLIIVKSKIVGIDTVDMGLMPLDSTFEAIGFPKTVAVTTQTGKKHFLSVTWDKTGFDSSTTGVKTVKGTLDIPEGYALDSSLTNEVTATVTISDKIIGAADIVFLIDTTGSMGDEISNVRRNIKMFSQALNSYGIVLRWALVEYRDITCDGKTSTKIHLNGTENWYLDVASYERAIDSLTVTGGGDYEETVIDALEAAQLLDRRENASQFFIVVTDADWKVENQYGVTSMDSEISRLLSKGINTSVVTKTSCYSDYRNLTTRTGGILANIDGNFKDELLKIVDLIYCEIIDLQIESISITKKPDKLTYVQGDRFDGSGMIVTAYYKNGSSREITAYSVMPYGALSKSDTKVTVDYRGHTDDVEITVTEPEYPVKSVSLNKSTLNLVLGYSETLIATVYPSNATNKNVSWSSSNPNIAFVNENGVVTANGIGTATVTVTTDDGGFTAECTVTVTAPEVKAEEIELDKTGIVLYVGDSQTVTATVYPENTTNKTVVWTSSDSSIAKVSADGVVTGIKKGTATITATSADGRIKAYCLVTVKAVEVTNLEIKTMPTKTEYFVGDTLDTTGLTLTATYNNGTTETITSGFTCSPTKLTTAGKQTITVSYGGKSCTFDVTVKAVELVKIEIKTLPTKTEYFVGDTLDTTGLTLTATYNNGTTETIATGFTCTPTKLNTAGKQTVTVSYGGKTCIFDVTVKAVELVKIEVKTLPTKTEYFVGDTLNTTGLTLTATYNNGTTETITSGFTCSPTKFTTAGKQTITVTYGGKTCTFDVTVKAVELVKIEIKTLPTKTEYFVGDALNTTGLTLTATYNNGTTETITSGFTCSPMVLNTAGKQTITVTYGGKTCTFDVTVRAVELVKIEVKTLPTKTEYFVGDTLDTTGLTLTAIYNNGTTETITSSFTCSPMVLNTAGKQTITVSYGGKTCTFDVEVEQKDYSVTYMVNGKRYAKYIVTVGDPVPAPAVNPIVDGMIFEGWSPEIVQLMPANDLVYTAVFHKHVYTGSIAIHPTCTQHGVMLYTCSCGDSYNEIIPALGHDWGRWITVVEATPSSNGQQVRYCSRCGAAEYDVIPAPSANFRVEPIADQEYTGFGLYPAVKVYSLSGKRLDEYDHYEVSYENNINYGVATATVKGVGEYSGVIKVNFNIVKKDIANLSFAEIPDVTYSGDAYTPDPVIYYGDILLVKDVDYTVSYSANVNIGKATITITGIGNYTGTKVIYFNISKNSTSFSVPVVGSQVYTGKAVTPDFNLFSGDKLLIKGVDYTVTYENNINVGYGRIIIKGIGNYSGTIVVIFRIVSTQISLATVPSFSDIAYSGNEFTPDFNANPITYGGKKLVEGVDFKVEIYNNRNAGTVKIVIIGIGNFTGTIVIYVNINAVDISGVTVSRIDDVEYNGAAQTPLFKVTKNGKTLVKGVDYTVEYRNNIFVGTATVVIKGIGNYKGEKSFTFRIVEPTYYELVVTTESETLGYDSIMQVWAEINPYLEMNYTFIYESSNAKIASVDENGVVKALDEGEVVISVTVVDENGNPVLNPDGEEIRSEIRIRCTMTFWQKIIKFFRSIAAFFTNLFTFSIGLQMQ